MNRYLQECQKVYRNLIHNPAFYDKVRVVLGNESCDLDSAISSLVYAYIMHHENKQKGVRNYEVLPFLNVSLEDFPLKTEVTFYLRLHAICLDNILTKKNRDNFCLSKLHKAGVLELTLVDHQTLSVSDQELAPAVVEIIDHRPRETDLNAQKIDITVEQVGSCCTLIAQKILQRSPHLLTFQICHLLYGPILLDTFNFSVEAGKTTDTDKQVISSLEKKISVDRNRLFQDLVYAKTQVVGLTESQILRKDLKIIGGIPVCGLPMLVEEFIRRQYVEEALLNFLKSRSEIPIIMLMGVRINGENVDKDLAVMSTQSSLADKLIEALITFDAPSLGLKELSDHKVKFLRLFSQSNIRMSRKQISPIIQNVNPSLKDVAIVVWWNRLKWLLWMRFNVKSVICVCSRFYKLTKVFDTQLEMKIYT